MIISPTLLVKCPVCEISSVSLTPYITADQVTAELMLAQVGQLVCDLIQLFLGTRRQTTSAKTNLASDQFHCYGILGLYMWFGCKERGPSCMECLCMQYQFRLMHRKNSNCTNIHMSQTSGRTNQQYIPMHAIMHTLVTASQAVHVCGGTHRTIETWVLQLYYYCMAGIYSHTTYIYVKLYYSMYAGPLCTCVSYSLSFSDNQ